jgi:superfamily I DNA/RNA helicase
VDVSSLANLINAFAVTAGVIFAAVQIRYYRQRRRRDAMIELVRSFQSPSFTSAFRRILSLPDDATTEQIQEKLGPDGEEVVYFVTLTWESLGVMLFRGEVTIDLIDDFFSGPILISWRKLNVFVEEDRRALDRNTASEWFQMACRKNDRTREKHAGRSGAHRSSRMEVKCSGGLRPPKKSNDGRLPNRHGGHRPPLQQRFFRRII